MPPLTRRPVGSDLAAAEEFVLWACDHLDRIAEEEGWAAATRNVARAALRQAALAWGDLSWLVRLPPPTTVVPRQRRHAEAAPKTVDHIAWAHWRTWSSALQMISDDAQCHPDGGYRAVLWPWTLATVTTGLRIGEWRTVQWNSASGTLAVDAEKGGFDRILVGLTVHPQWSSVAEAITVTVQAVRYAEAAGRWRSFALAMNDGLAAAWARCGFPPSLCPTAHALRHQAIANWTASYGRTVAAAMAGHRNPETTRSWYAGGRHAWPLLARRDVLCFDLGENTRNAWSELHPKASFARLDEWKRRLSYAGKGE